MVQESGEREGAAEVGSLFMVNVEFQALNVACGVDSFGQICDYILERGYRTQGCA